MDANDNFPKFTDIPSQINVIENSVNVSICQLRALDHDLGPNGKISYSFESANDAFYLDPNVSV